MTSRAGILPFPSARGIKPLADGAGQSAGQAQTDLTVLVGREEIDDPVDRLRRRGGVQGREDEVPGLGRRQGREHRLRVAHLPDEDDIGVLAENHPHGAGERLGVESDLSLVDGGVGIGVEVLDGVLDGDDVARTRLVDVIDHGRQSGGLPRAGRSRHQDETTLLLGQASHHFGECQLPDGGRAGADTSHGQRHRTTLVEGVDAEPAHAGHAVGEVGLVLLGEDLADVGKHDGLGQQSRFLGTQTGLVIECAQVPVHTYPGRRARLDVKVRTVEVAENLQQSVEVVQVHADPVYDTGKVKRPFS